MVDVSVIVPFYNTEKYLGRNLKSLLRQKEIDAEFIFIDDSSTDRSFKIVEKLSRKYPQIKLIRQEHKGAGIARNTGISNASGRYIAFLDADDIYPIPNSLHKLVEFADRNGLDICGGFRTLKYRLKVKEGETNRKECKGHPEGVIVDYADTQIDYDYSNFIFRREFLLSNKIDFPDFARYQDVPFLVEAMHRAGRYGIYPVECYRYTLHPDRPVVFDENNTVGLLQGILRTLKLAELYSYNELRKRTLDRFRDEYLPRIPSKILDGHQDILQQIGSNNGNKVQ